MHLCRRSFVVERRNLRKFRRIDTVNTFLTAIQTPDPSNRLALLKRKIAQILERISLQPIEKTAKPLAHGDDALCPRLIRKEI